MHPAQTGAVSETKVTLALLEQGFNVLLPVVPDRYDLAAQRSERVWFVQVKTGRIDSRNGTLKASWDEPYSFMQVDVIAVVDGDNVYYLQTQALEAGTKSVTIRFTPVQHDKATKSFLATDCMEFPFP